MDFPTVRCAGQILSTGRSSPFFGPLSYYIISSQENNSVPKECSHENLLLHFEIQARLCSLCNHQYKVGAAWRLLWCTELAEFVLQPRNLGSTGLCLGRLCGSLSPKHAVFSW